MWMHELKFQKIVGLFSKWIILHTKADFEEIVQIHKEAKTDGQLKLPESFPCMAWLYDAGPLEVGVFPTAIYFYLFEARELAEAHGFDVSRKKDAKTSNDPDEW